MKWEIEYTDEFEKWREQVSFSLSTWRRWKIMAKSFDILKNKLSKERKIAIEQRIEDIIETMPLSELRQARQFTQEKLARSMKIKQASISKMEGQTDMYISTLRKYIKAMGGDLEIIAKFPEGSVRIEKFEPL